MPIYTDMEVLYDIVKSNITLTLNFISWDLSALCLIDSPGDELVCQWSSYHLDVLFWKFESKCNTCECDLCILEQNSKPITSSWLDTGCIWRTLMRDAWLNSLLIALYLLSWEWMNSCWCIQEFSKTSRVDALETSLRFRIYVGGSFLHSNRIHS